MIKEISIVSGAEHLNGESIQFKLKNKSSKMAFFALRFPNGVNWQLISKTCSSESGSLKTLPQKFLELEYRNAKSDLLVLKLRLTNRTFLVDVHVDYSLSQSFHTYIIVDNTYADEMTWRYKGEWKTVNLFVEKEFNWIERFIARALDTYHSLMYKLRG